MEAGAQWLHGTTNTLYEFSRQYNLLSNTEAGEAMGPYLTEDGRVINPEIINEITGAVNSFLEDCCSFNNTLNFPSSVGSYLDKRLEEYLGNRNLEESKLRLVKEIYDWIIRFELIDNSCEDLYELSAKYWGDYEDEGRQDHVSFTSGMSSLVDRLVDLLPGGSLVTSCPVKNIDWAGEKVVISCENGRIIEGDAVIVTVSLGVLKKGKDKLFNPLLPKRISTTVESLGFKSICKIFLVFSEAWWLPEEGFQLLWSCDRSYGDDWTRYMTGFDIVHGQDNVLVGWVGGKGAELVAQVPEEQVGVTCVNLLKKFLKRKDIQEPVKVFR